MSRIATTPLGSVIPCPLARLAERLARHRQVAEDTMRALRIRIAEPGMNAAERAVVGQDLARVWAEIQEMTTFATWIAEEQGTDTSKGADT